MPRSPVIKNVLHYFRRNGFTAAGETHVAMLVVIAVFFASHLLMLSRGGQDLLSI